MCVGWGRGDRDWGCTWGLKEAGLYSEGKAQRVPFLLHQEDGEESEHVLMTDTDYAQCVYSHLPPPLTPPPQMTRRCEYHILFLRVGFRLQVVCSLHIFHQPLYHQHRDFSACSAGNCENQAGFPSDSEGMGGGGGRTLWYQLGDFVQTSSFLYTVPEGRL